MSFPVVRAGISQNLKNMIDNPVKVLVENNKNFWQESAVLDGKRQSMPFADNKKPVSNKENSRLSEVSTQTSFLIDNVKPEKKRQSLSSSSFNTSLNKAKIQEMILNQKKKHEKRIKELETLAELERIQAEKLKLLMLDSHNDSSLMANSFFTTDFSNKNQQQSSLARRKSSSQIAKQQQYQQNKFSHMLEDESDFDLSTHTLEESSNKNSNSLSSRRQSRVQILELKNTTIHEQPSGVFVVKENSTRNIFDQNTKSLSYDRRKTEIYSSRITPVSDSKRHSNFFAMPSKRMSLMVNKKV